MTKFRVSHPDGSFEVISLGRPNKWGRCLMRRATYDRHGELDIIGMGFLQLREEQLQLAV